MRLSKITYCSLLFTLMAFQQTFAMESIEMEKWQQVFQYINISDEQQLIVAEDDASPSDDLPNLISNQDDRFQTLTFSTSDHKLSESTTPLSINLYSKYFVDQFVPQSIKSIQIIPAWQTYLYWPHFESLRAFIQNFNE